MAKGGVPCGLGTEYIRVGNVLNSFYLWLKIQARQDLRLREIDAVLFQGTVLLGNIADQFEVFVSHSGSMILEKILIGSKI